MVGSVKNGSLVTDITGEQWEQTVVGFPERQLWDTTDRSRAGLSRLEDGAGEGVRDGDWDGDDERGMRPNFSLTRQ